MNLVVTGQCFQENSGNEKLRISHELSHPIDQIQYCAHYP